EAGPALLEGDSGVSEDALHGGRLELEAEPAVQDLNPDVRDPVRRVTAREPEIAGTAVERRSASAVIVPAESGKIARQELRPVGELRAGVHHQLSAGEREARELRTLQTRDAEHPLIDVVELSRVVRLSVLVSEGHGAFAREVPGSRNVEIERLDAGHELQAINRRLIVVVDAVAGIVEHAEAPVMRHASEAELADRRRILGPSALDVNAVGER